MNDAILRVRNALTKRIGTRPLIRLAKWAIPALVTAVFWDWITQTAIPAVLSGLGYIATLQIGMVGLVLAAALLTLMILCFIDEIPIVAAVRRWRDKAPPLRSEDEERLVQDIRVVWGRHGLASVEALADIYHDVVREISQRHYWGRLLESTETQLRVTTAELSDSINDRTQSLQAVRASFNQMYAAYYAVMKMLAQITKAGDNHLEHYDRKLREWHELSRLFRDKLEDMLQQPKHHDTLKVYVGFPEEPFGSFLRAAESPKARPLPDSPTPPAGLPASPSENPPPSGTNSAA